MKTIRKFIGLGKLKKTPFSLPSLTPRPLSLSLSDHNIKKLVIKQPLVTQSLIPGFKLIGDRDLILDDCPVSIMTKKSLIIKGCSKKKGHGCKFD